MNRKSTGNWSLHPVEDAVPSSGLDVEGLGLHATVWGGAQGAQHL